MGAVEPAKKGNICHYLTAASLFMLSGTPLSRIDTLHPATQQTLLLTI